MIPDTAAIRRALGLSQAEFAFAGAGDAGLTGCMTTAGAEAIEAGFDKGCSRSPPETSLGLRQGRLDQLDDLIIARIAED